MTDLEEKYESFYRERDSASVYPVEFVVRAFLGTYPRLKTEKSLLQGSRILDLGFGDGRNVPLLSDLGMEVYGVEITREICDRAMARMKRMGIRFDARVGRNAHLPFEDAFFDHVLACHACYYVDPGERFSDNVAEIARVMKPGGLFVHSLPIGTTYIMRGAVDTGDRHMQIAADPYGVRNGYILKSFDTSEQIEAELGPFFTDFRIGACRNDWWGIEEHVWTVACRRR